MTKYVRETLRLALVVFATSSCGNSDDNNKGATCTVPAACGGTLDGTWQVDSICIQGDLEASLFAGSGLPAACNNLFRLVSYGCSGTVTYANGIQTSNVTSTISAEALYTQACVTATRGASATLDAAICTAFQQSYIASGIFTSANCAYSGEGCRCALAGQSTDTSAVSYTVSNNQIVFTNGDPPIAYCVSGTTMTSSVATPTPQGVLTTVSTMHHI
jgi:hypothetical protein